MIIEAENFLAKNRELDVNFHVVMSRAEEVDIFFYLKFN